MDAFDSCAHIVYVLIKSFYLVVKSCLRAKIPDDPCIDALSFTENPLARN